jgi:putative addiction module component (TIGR02574 family)
MNKSLLKELLELTPAGRIELAADPWDSIEPGELPPLTSEQIEECERRYSEHMRDPSSASKWEDVKARLLARYK